MCLDLALYGYLVYTHVCVHACPHLRFVRHPDSYRVFFLDEEEMIWPHVMFVHASNCHIWHGHRTELATSKRAELQQVQ